MNRDQIKAWKCECGAGPEAIVWTENVAYVRQWDGDGFFSVDEQPSDVEFTCEECGRKVPEPDDDILSEAINN
jgi:hypothetical protein